MSNKDELHKTIRCMGKAYMKGYEDGQAAALDAAFEIIKEYLKDGTIRPGTKEKMEELIAEKNDL